MNGANANAVRLRGVLEQTTTWARIEADGGLCVELYDFSSEAHACLGNDVAFLLHVAAADKPCVLGALLEDRNGLPAASEVADATLLRILAERFADYYDVKGWLEAHGIPYRKEFEPWA